MVVKEGLIKSFLAYSINRANELHNEIYHRGCSVYSKKEAEKRLEILEEYDSIVNMLALLDIIDCIDIGDNKARPEDIIIEA